MIGHKAKSCKSLFQIFVIFKHKRIYEKENFVFLYVYYSFTFMLCFMFILPHIKSLHKDIKCKHVSLQK